MLYAQLVANSVAALEQMVTLELRHRNSSRVVDGSSDGVSRLSSPFLPLSLSLCIYIYSYKIRD